MKQPKPPNDIARQAIKLLADRKLEPTPINYGRAYSEVSGVQTDSQQWAQAIRDLIREWEAYQEGFTQAKKREMLERALLAFGTDSYQLFERIAGLTRTWAESPHTHRGVQDDDPLSPAKGNDAPPSQAAPPRAAADVSWWPDSLGVLAEGLENRWPDLARRCRDLAARSGDLGPDFRNELDAVWREILLRAEDDYELLQGMQRLVRLLLDNIASLVGEDAWLKGQLVAMRTLIDGQLNYHALFEAERGLHEIVAKQGRLKDHLQESKSKLKQLISTFIDRLGEISSNTDTYQERLATYSERIAQADDISQLADVVDQLTTDMGDIQTVMRQSHEELIEARSHVVQAELRIVALEKELDQVSSLIREDQLTGALNRRGLEEAFAREVARAQRMHGPLSLALLDIDHFKRLNDSLGHQAGDQALIHLARVIRDLLRPTDALSRWGGEEFLILLPNTDLDEATQVLRRLQRELTKSIFLHDNKKVLITFSAGVVQWHDQESREQVIARADAAMYRAKAAGRNRVERQD